MSKPARDVPGSGPSQCGLGAAVVHVVYTITQPVAGTQDTAHLRKTLTHIHSYSGRICTYILRSVEHGAAAQQAGGKMPQDKANTACHQTSINRTENIFSIA